MMPPAATTLTRRGFLMASAAAAVACASPRTSASSSDTAFLDSLLAPGGNVTVPAGTYQIEYMRPRSGSIITMEPGCQFFRGGTPFPVLELRDVQDVHMLCNGALFDGSQGAPLSSHTVSLLGARNVIIDDPYIRGTKGAKDCAYFGLGNAECYNALISGGTIEGAGRNGASLVAAIRSGLDGVEISGALNSPGAGIDFEANNHSYLNFENFARNCYLHHNNGSGLLVVFAERVLLEGNLSEYNQRGIHATSGGNTRKIGGTRKNIDVMGVVSFDQATGLIKVGGGLDLLQPGSLVSFQPSNGATLPAQLAPQLYTVTSRGQDNDIRVGSAVDFHEFTSFSTPATGNLDADPELSDIVMSVFGLNGQSFGTRAIGNVTRFNDKEGIHAAVHGGIEIIGNESKFNGQQQISVKGGPGVVVSDNDTGEGSGAYDAISISSAHGAVAHRNKVANVGGFGINLIAASNGSVLDNEITAAALGDYRVDASSNVQKDF